jgi:hypothetical protein
MAVSSGHRSFLSPSGLIFGARQRHRTFRLQSNRSIDAGKVSSPASQAGGDFCRLLLSARWKAIIGGAALAVPDVAERCEY